jgi:long-chain acyl-CoA synthetase
LPVPKARSPDFSAGCVCSGERRLGIDELMRRARQAAGGFAALGIGEGDAVALMLRNDIAGFEATLGAAMLGAYAVPVNWHYRGDEAGYVFADSGAKAIVIHADLLASIGAETPPAATVLVVPTPPEVAAAYEIEAIACAVPPGATNWDRWVAGQAPWPAPPRRSRGNMIYTSGTTGRPKGVRRQPPADAAGEQAIANLFANVMGISGGMRTVLTGPLYHSAPAAYAFRAVGAGATIILQPRFDAEELLRLVEAQRISHLLMVPTMFVRLLRLPPEVRARYDTSSLQWVIHGAAPCPPEVKRAMIDWWGPVIYEYYGSTEAGLMTCSSSAEWLERPGTVGRPVATATVRVLGEDGRRLGPGEVGEIYAWVGAVPDFTYHNRHDARLEVERDGLITNGDIGYMDDAGYLYLCDRKLDMVISGGVNIYPAEIEAVLIAMPGVRDCAVFGIPDDELGEALAAIVEPEPGASLSADQVSAWLRQRQAGYKTPRLIEFRADLPREDSGKMFKRKLREPYWQNAGRHI